MNDINYEYRIGIGTDIHRLIENKPLKLAGIHIPFDKGLLAHSDGDVVLHAIIDAILGASGAGDIGTIFPDTDPTLAGVDSRELVVKVREYIREQNWKIVNVDTTITIEEPKLGKFKGQMKRSVASLLDIDFLNVNIKAKTNEGLGEVGNGLAIEALATVLLKRRIKKTL